MMKPRKKLKRKIGDAIQDVKQKFNANKGSRKIKRTMKDSAEKTEKVTRDRREERKERLTKKTIGRDSKAWKNTRFSDSEVSKAEKGGLDIKKTKKVVESGSSKRARRTLGRMKDQDKRRLTRKLK